MASAQPKLFPLGDDYVVLKALSLGSETYLCRERASDRLLVIKVFPLTKENFFRSEIRALSALENSELAPRLYFARRCTGGFAVGLQYLPGKSLQEGRGTWDAEEKSKIASALATAVTALHENWNFAHLDLSPQNILVKKTEAEFEVLFVDWERAVSLVNERLSGHGLSGTLGFMADEDARSLQDRDEAALLACYDFLGVRPLLGVVATNVKKGWLRWT